MLKISNIAIDLKKNNEDLQCSVKLKKFLVYDINLMSGEGNNSDL